MVWCQRAFRTPRRPALNSARRVADLLARHGDAANEPRLDYRGRPVGWRDFLFGCADAARLARYLPGNQPAHPIAVVGWLGDHQMARSGIRGTGSCPTDPRGRASALVGRGCSYDRNAHTWWTATATATALRCVWSLWVGGRFDPQAPRLTLSPSLSGSIGGGRSPPAADLAAQRLPAVSVTIRRPVTTVMGSLIPMSSRSGTHWSRSLRSRRHSGPVGEDFGHTGDDDTPAGPRLAVEVVDLDREHAAVGGGGQARVGGGAEHDVPGVDRVVHRQHGGQGVNGEDHPAHPACSQQGDGLVSVKHVDAD
jgi:hypothetical protein